ncbi:class F sortase [Streptomyces sp. NPDC005494]|uniref:class F sortase n=1 Tax=unclassified Streptomyces TaxID=2593676 RepID=UPI0036A3440A
MRNRPHAKATRCEAEAHAMRTGRRTSTPSPQSFPAVKHLVWAFVVGTVLVVTGLRDNSPPQPPAARTVTAPAPPADFAAAPSTVRRPGPTPSAVRVPAYLAPERPAPAAPSYMRPATAPPALLPPRYVRPAPLLPPPVNPSRTTEPGAASTPGPAPRGTATASRPAVQPLPPATPLRLRIPSITVNAPLMELGLDEAGALEPPPDNNPVLAGWYAGGTVPGAVGTAVATGHVDTRVGPGVFHKLGALRKGSTIEVDRADQRTAVFTVYAIEVYSKKNFPDQKVYGPSTRPELRVITCGGDYTKKSGYQDNVVVFASLTSSR